MRRPLACAGLVFILILLIIQLIKPEAEKRLPFDDGETVRLSGELVRIEKKTKEDGIHTIWYLTVPDVEDMLICYMAGADGDILDDISDVPLGAMVSVRGRVSLFSHATNPGQFDMKDYYDICHISAALMNVEALSVDDSHISPYKRLLGKLASVRMNIGALADLCFDEDDASVIRAMLLGDKSAMSPETKSLYSRNGIAHILAISGLHISMLGMALVTLLKKCRVPTGISAGTAIVLMIMYGLMTGMAASAMRAVIMFSLRMLADIVHRTYDMATALVVAAVLVLIEQPAYLFYSGFQFSFGAMAAVMLILPALEDVFPKIFSGCVAINIVTLPIYLHNYFYYPIMSVVLNLYIIPLMSFLLGLSLIAVAGCALWIPLGKVLAFPSHLILLIYEYSCKLADKVSWNRYVTGKPLTSMTIIYIVLITLVIVLGRYQTKLQIMMHLLFCCIMLTFNPATGISVMMIDVGQGDGIYITDHCGTDILIDGGSSDVSDVGTYRIAPFLYSQGVASVDALFITHLDADHYNGSLELLEDAGGSLPRVEALYLTSSAVKMGAGSMSEQFISSACVDSDAESSSDTGNPAYESLVRAATDSGIPVYVVTAGDKFSAGVLEFTCLYPDSACLGEDTNNESLVLDMKYDEVHFIFTGDIGGEGEDAMCAYLPDVVDPEDTVILKVAHHGSRFSSSDMFLDEAGADIALISAGRDNSYGHPHAELIERLNMRNIPYFNTADHGAVRVDIRHGTIRITGFTDL
ncbi:MAG: DNA internalization-related competence protein ComEC/Rec2 [Lachnospiraceae bacterium]|nr:DNA internalization-related competence protein ComEC/Rec2 [Lachnospiraceae bacterium]